MADPTWRFIEFCWAAWALCRLVMAFATKRTVEREGFIGYRLVAAINNGRAIGFGLLVALCGALWWKARQEERIMSRHFPDAYADYKLHVAAIIPFLL